MVLLRASSLKFAGTVITTSLMSPMMREHSRLSLDRISAEISAGVHFGAVDLHEVLGVVHVALDLEDRAVRVAAVARGAADEFHLLVRIEVDHGGREPLAVRVGHDFRDCRPA